MANVHILQDINSKEYRLGSVHEQKLEKSMDLSIMSISELKLNDHNEQLQRNVYRQRTLIRKESSGIRKKSSGVVQQITDKIERNNIAQVYGKKKLESAQENSSLKVSKIETLKTKLPEVELVSKELVIHSLESKLSSEPIKIDGEMDEKNIPISKDISADSKPVKILVNFFTKNNASVESSTHTEPYKNIDTKLIPIPSEEKSYNHIWEIGNVTPYLEKQESTISFPVETHPRISMEV
nr:12425_t:CDS:2 [Entrophospora candida]